MLFVTTPRILYVMIRDGDLTCDKAWEIYTTMRLRRCGLADVTKDELCTGRINDQKA